jgi:biopolymer transport protein ExbD
VVFLLQTFSISGELSLSKSIVLPEAQSFTGIEQAPIIAVSRDVVTLNGAPMADTTELVRDDSIDRRLPRLYDDLVTLRNNFKQLHPDPKDWKGTVLVQADRAVDFKALKKVMYTAGAAGYFNVSFAVLQKGRGG